MAVGLLNTAVGVLAFPFLYWIFRGRLGVNALLILSTIFCAGFSYSTHKILTFQSRGACHIEIGKFALLSFVVYLINLAVLNTLPDLTGIHPVIAQTATTLILSFILMMLNYFGMNYFVFVSRSYVK